MKMNDQERKQLLEDAEYVANVLEVPYTVGVHLDAKPTPFAVVEVHRSWASLADDLPGKIIGSLLPILSRWTLYMSPTAGMQVYRTGLDPEDVAGMTPE